MSQKRRNMENFITIRENVQTEIVVKKSKFICNLIKVETQEEAENIIKQIKMIIFIWHRFLLEL